MTTEALETRAGVESLDALHAERRKLVLETAALRKQVGDYRHREARRKVVLAWCILEVRSKAEKRLTDATAEAMARTQPRYTNHLDATEAADERLAILENEVQTINDRIRSRETELHFVRAEMGLAHH